MHDANGTPLKVGDTVLIPCTITRLTEGSEEYCNVSVSTNLGRRPDGAKEQFSAINTAVLIKFMPLLLVMLFALSAFAQEPTPAPTPDAVIPAAHATGLKLPALNVRTANHQADARRHAIHNAKLMMRLAEAFPATYDCRNLCTPIKDQGQCGSCWDHSLVEVVESANILRKNLTKDSASALSTQYVLDGCAFRNGGCNGDDASNGFAWLKAGGGLPLASVYGPYVASRQSCQLSTTATGYTINDWGYCSTSTGVASTDLIKAAMLQYGPISVCIAADNAFIGFAGGKVFKDTGYSEINHQVVVAGWDDAKGAWLLRNSWGTEWADGGYCWIAYGANQVGTEAMWATAGTPVVLRPSGPTPPPTPSPTRRFAALLADVEGLVAKYQDGTEEDKAQVLSLLDEAEKRVKSTKRQLGIAN